MTTKEYLTVSNSATKPLGLTEFFRKKAREAKAAGRPTWGWLGCADIAYRLDHNKPVGHMRRRRKSSAGRRDV